MKGNTHQDRIANWLSEIGVTNRIKNKNLLKKIHNNKLNIYSNKSGVINRFEANLKDNIGYNLYPKFIKKSLRYLKRNIIG